jgi:ABC-type iron transport system FetAB ATPase subunit
MEKKITVINILGVLAVLIAVQIGYIFFKGKDLSSIIEPTIYSVVSAILIWTSGKTI